MTEQQADKIIALLEQINNKLFTVEMATGTSEEHLMEIRSQLNKVIEDKGE